MIQVLLLQASLFETLPVSPTGDSVQPLAGWLMSTVNHPTLIVGCSVTPFRIGPRLAVVGGLTRHATRCRIGGKSDYPKQCSYSQSIQCTL